MKSEPMLPSLMPYTPPDRVAYLSSSCRDVETLAQRIKRASISASGQPPAGTSSTPLVVSSSLDSSPQPSPQRKSTIHPPLTCVMRDASVLTVPWMQERSSTKGSHRGLLRSCRLVNYTAPRCVPGKGTTH